MISVFVATSGRQQMFWSMLHSLRNTTQGWELEITAVIDDDPLSDKWAHEFGVDVVDYSETRRGALWSWNKAFSLTKGNYLVPTGDDQLFHKGWLEYALSAHEERLNGYGVVGMNDLAYNGNTQLATMFLFDRAYCKKVMGGIFAPPMYHYYNIDSEWNEKAKTLGRYYWESNSVVEHLHSAHGKRPIDDLDREKMDAGWMEIDNKTFEERKARGFPVTWEPLI